MVGLTGINFGLKGFKEFVGISKKNTQKDPPENLKSNRVDVICAAGRLGYPKEGPFLAV